MRKLLVVSMLMLVIGLLLHFGAPKQQVSLQQYEELNAIQKFSHCYFDKHCLVNIKEHVAKLTNYEWSTAGTSANDGSIKCADFIFHDLVWTRIEVTCAGANTLQFDVRELYPNVEIPVKPLFLH